MMKKLEELALASARKLNAEPTEENLNIFLTNLKNYSDAYKEEHGHRPKIAIEQIILCLGLEVIKLYKDRLPYGENIIPFDDED